MAKSGYSAKSLKIGILALGFLAVGLLGGYYLGHEVGYEKAAPVKEERIQQDETSDWQIYIDQTNGFSVKYPKDWKEETETSGTEASFMGSKDTDGYPPYIGIVKLDSDDSADQVVRGHAASGVDNYRVVKTSRDSFVIFIYTYQIGLTTDTYEKLAADTQPVFQNFVATFKPL